MARQQELIEATDAAPFNTLPIKYGVADSKIAELRSMYLPLTIAGVEDASGLKVVHEARMTVKNLRIDVEKTRQALKASALEYGRKVDSEAKRITAELLPIEQHLQQQEDAIAAEKQRIKEAKVAADLAKLQARLAALKAVGCTDLVPDIVAMTDEQFDQRLAVETEKDRIRKEQAAAEKAEADRLEAIEKQRLADEAAERARVQAEQDRLRKEESDRLAAERAELDRQRAENERLLQEVREAQAKVEAQQRAEAERLAAERRKLDEQLAAEQARVDAQRRAEELARVEQEALERGRREAEERQEAGRQAALAAWQRRLVQAERLHGSLPDDVADAFETFKLVIMRHKAENWEELSANDMRNALELLRGLIEP